MLAFLLSLVFHISVTDYHGEASYGLSSIVLGAVQIQGYR